MKGERGDRHGFDLAGTQDQDLATKRDRLGIAVVVHIHPRPLELVGQLAVLLNLFRLATPRLFTLRPQTQEAVQLRLEVGKSLQCLGADRDGTLVFLDLPAQVDRHHRGFELRRIDLPGSVGPLQGLPGPTPGERPGPRHRGLVSPLLFDRLAPMLTLGHDRRVGIRGDQAPFEQVLHLPEQVIQVAQLVALAGRQQGLDRRTHSGHGLESPFSRDIGKRQGARSSLTDTWRNSWSSCSRSPKWDLASSTR